MPFKTTLIKKREYFVHPVVQRFLEGNTRHEIADILNLDYSSVCKQLVRRGITKRRERIVREKIRTGASRVCIDGDDDLCGMGSVAVGDVAE